MGGLSIESSALLPSLVACHSLPLSLDFSHTDILAVPQTCHTPSCPRALAHASPFPLSLNSLSPLLFALLISINFLKFSSNCPYSPTAHSHSTCVINGLMFANLLEGKLLEGWNFLFCHFHHCIPCDKCYDLYTP